MKILKLSFKNLNSLTGTWNIDFSRPSFTSSGIFVITGPTGSGKTTVLDAMCLALYGRTPRLGKVTKSGNHIMSRHTGECSAEVVFESQKGKFICNWSQKRAHNKPNGELQAPRHEISKLDTGEILATKISLVGDMVEEVTGMTYDQFTRSILLAQGGFAAFLQAGSDDRAPILEQITGTEIYTTISVRTHERYSKELDRLEDIKKELEHIEALSPEEKNNLIQQIIELRIQAEKIESAITESTNAIRWLEALSQLREDTQKILLEKEDLERKIILFEPEKRKLQAGKKAALYEGIYSVIKEKRKNQEHDRNRVQDLEIFCKNLEKEIITHEKEVLKATEELAEAEEKTKIDQDIIKKVREKDTHINELKNRILQLKNERENRELDLKTYQNQFDEKEKKLQEIQDTQTSANFYIHQHTSDAILLEKYSGIEEKISFLQEKFKSLGELKSTHSIKKNEIEKTGKTRTELEEKKKHQQELLQVAVTEYQGTEKKLHTLLEGKTLSDLRNTYEELRARIDRMTGLEEVATKIIEINEKLSSLDNNLVDIAFYLDASGCEITRLSTDLSHHERELETKRKYAILTAKVRDLTKERNHLIDGSPCPLCGSTHHPYVHEETGDPDVAYKEFLEEEKTVKNLNRQLSELNISVQNKTDESKKNQHEISELRDKKASYDKIWYDELKELGIETGMPGRIDITSIVTIEKDRINRLKPTISTAESYENTLKKYSERINAEKDLLTELDNQFRDKNHEFQTQKDFSEQLESDIINLNKIIDMSIAEINNYLEGLSEEVTRETNTTALLLIFKNRRDRYQKEVKVLDICEKEIGRLDENIRNIKANRTKILEDLTEKQKKIQIEESDLNNHISERNILFGEKDPDQEEELLASRVILARETYDDRMKEKTTKQVTLKSSQENIGDLKKQIEKNLAELSEKEHEFFSMIQNAGFPEESSFLEALLPHEKFKELEEIFDKFSSEQTRMNTRLEDLQTRYQKEREKDITQFPKEELELHLEKLQAEKIGIFSNIGKYEEQLSRHEEMVRLLGDKIREQESRQREVERWHRLHELIGSADGKKFRIFAQGLTFCILLQHANEHLKRMTDRYILIQDPDMPLDMQVIDTWQGGVARSVKNLSGGEVFMVSLALALGLSGMASKNVRVDSLFLDEGFGTLDDEALETALATLSGLRQDGKLIGVISHVAALKDRIPTRIIIEKGSNGQSKILIPG